MSERTRSLTQALKSLYDLHNDRLPAHGWHHIEFVTHKALEFAAELGADGEMVEAAALVHDLNYLADPTSPVEEGSVLRAEYLQPSGFDRADISRIELIVRDAAVKNRHPNISIEAKALADGESLYKVLPITPVVFSGKFIAETGTSLEQWANTIVRQQKPLLESDAYFYTPTARAKYRDWARLNLELIQAILDSLDDPDIAALASELQAQ